MWAYGSNGSIGLWVQEPSSYGSQTYSIFNLQFKYYYLLNFLIRAMGKQKKKNPQKTKEISA